MAKSKPVASPTYQELKTELDSLLLELQRPDLDIDEALRYYQRGLEVVQQIEQYLGRATNSVRELKAKFNQDAS